VLQIRLGDKFNGAVHVAIGDSNQSRGAACAGDLNSGSIIAGRISECVDLEWDIASGGLSGEEFENHRAGISTTNKNRATSDFDPAKFILIDSGTVGGMSNIDSDGDIRGDGEGTGRGTSQPNFLLNRGHGDDFAGGSGSGDLSQGLHDDPNAGAVVHGNTGESAVAEFAEAGFGCNEVTNSDEGAGFGFRGGADVDPEILYFGDGLAFIGVQQVDGFSRDDSGDRSGCSLYQHALTEQDLKVPAAHRVHSQKPVAVDVADNKSDLVAVGIEKYGASPSGVDYGVDVAVDIGGDLIGEL